MRDGDQLDRIFSRKAAILGWIAAPICYALLLVEFPEYWAIATGIIIVLATGLFTAKTIVGLENPWAVLGLTPLFGTGWLVLFWLLFKLAG
jgi:hypothetical protein